MKYLVVLALSVINIMSLNAKHVPEKSVLSYMQCIHSYECFTEGDVCCQATPMGGDGTIMLRCGPWLDYSGYTGTINGYMYKCEDNAKYLVASVVLSLASLISVYC